MGQHLRMSNSIKIGTCVQGLNVIQLCESGTKVQMCPDQCPDCSQCPSAYTVTVSGFTQVDCAFYNNGTHTFTRYLDQCSYFSGNGQIQILCSVGKWIFKQFGYSSFGGKWLELHVTGDLPDCLLAGTYTGTATCGGLTENITVVVA